VYAFVSTLPATENVPAMQPVHADPPVKSQAFISEHTPIATGRTAGLNIESTFIRRRKLSCLRG
jgi:hypothetical protein